MKNVKKQVAIKAGMNAKIEMLCFLNRGVPHCVQVVSTVELYSPHLGHLMTL